MWNGERKWQVNKNSLFWSRPWGFHLLPDGGFLLSVCMGRLAIHPVWLTFKCPEPLLSSILPCFTSNVTQSGSFILKTHDIQLSDPHLYLDAQQASHSEHEHKACSICCLSYSAGSPHPCCISQNLESLLFFSSSLTPHSIFPQIPSSLPQNYIQNPPLFPCWHPHLSHHWLWLQSIAVVSSFQLSVWSVRPWRRREGETNGHVRGVMRSFNGSALLPTVFLNTATKSWSC